MENLDSEFNILEIGINSGRERHIYVFLVSFKNFCKIQRQPSICLLVLHKCKISQMMLISLRLTVSTSKQ